jgi:hypothetical protein
MISHTYARAAVTWGGALLLSTYLVVTSLVQSGGISWVPLLAVLGITLLLGYGSRRVVDTLWAKPAGLKEQRTLETARDAGTLAAAIFTVGFGAFAIYESPPGLKVRATILFAALMLCFGFALWLCAGYLFATIMGRLYPEERSSGGG